MPAIPWNLANPIGRQNLTGKWRPRYQKWWRGAGYVIQVQVENIHNHFLDPEHKPTATTYEWRDASGSDLMQLGMKYGPAFDRSPPAEASA